MPYKAKVFFKKYCFYLSLFEIKTLLSQGIFNAKQTSKKILDYFYY